ncbi:MAG TPA: M12 family metallo-peptidase, partial [Candidatus Binatia bacterium]|nr:M12 family metallo-peptidase [Candidatus Binatia bacterium]
RPPIICFILSALLFAGCATLSNSAPQRLVRIQALADPAMRERNPQWDSELRGLIEAASDYYEREFEIRLVTRSTAAWPAAERIRSTSELLLKAKRDFPLGRNSVDHDLIIAFTGESVSRYAAAGRPRVDRIGNCHEGLSNYAVVPVREIFRYRGPAADVSYDAVALIHELGHVFGAEHVNDRSSIMNEQFDYRTEFDMKNRSIILQNRNCPFANVGISQ